VGQGYLFGHPLPLDELMASEVAERRELLITSIDGPIDFTASGRFRTARQPVAADQWRAAQSS
jgi:hypothetical protein